MSLRRSSDTEPGLRRLKRGRGFTYVDARGRCVRSAAALSRIRSLAIPPAYQEVWICADAQGHLQATGRDARGRKQYRYHPHWQQRRSARKYQRLARLGRCLPAIRRRLARDLKARALSRTHVLAAIVSLLDHTGLRIGSRKYLRQNGSYGLTTLRDRHLDVQGGSARLRFRGKSGIDVDVEIDHPQLTRTLRRCRDLPGDALLQYVDENGDVRAVSAREVNAYLTEIAGERFTAKDLRTWKANVQLLRLLRRDARKGCCNSRSVVEAVRQVADALGNTPAVCRRAYLDPAVVDACIEGTLATLRRASCSGLGAAERDYLTIAESDD